ncbi:hypothetical protein ZWY2020_009956 [Hordeum vulgare]|nr:hypothetical protein ZWY2020_009956 [Hordeum vulgare]
MPAFAAARRQRPVTSASSNLDPPVCRSSSPTPSSPLSSAVLRAAIPLRHILRAPTLRPAFTFRRSSTRPAKTPHGAASTPRRHRQEACQDLTLVILIVAAAISLALGIATEGINEGWYDGASIAFAVFLVILVTAVSDYKQSLQFQHLNEEKQNIQVEVIRGGRRIQVSIFDTVVGDVVALKIGDQVPSDGILISVHSLAIDESSMTGESKIVMKDQKSPFLMGGCKVVDGYGTMLVLLVTSKQVDLEYIKEGCIQHW